MFRSIAHVGLDGKPEGVVTSAVCGYNVAPNQVRGAVRGFRKAQSPPADTLYACPHDLRSVIVRKMTKREQAAMKKATAAAIARFGFDRYR